MKGGTQVSKSHYQKKYDNLNRFISYFYQIESVLKEDPKNVLEIGVGNKTVSGYLKRRGVNLTTCDIDPNLEPDVVANIKELPFKAGEFDVVMACEVLEHIHFEDLEKTLKHLRRAARKTVIISIPYVTFNIYWKCKVIPFIPEWKFLWRICEYSCFEHKFDGQHYWEMGKKGYSRRKIRKLLKKVGFKIRKEFTPDTHTYHYFFILEKS